MIHAQHEKHVVLIAPVSLATDATATGQVDCLGFNYLAVDVIQDTAADATNNPTVMKLSESDITDASGFSDITAMVGDGVGGFTVGNHDTAATEVGNPHRLNLDLKGHKRYIRLTLTSGGAATLSAAMAHLSRGEDGPITASQSGVRTLVNA